MRLVYGFVFWLALVIPSTLMAQGFSGSPSANLSTIPLAPEPLSETTVSLDAYTLDTIGATIVWFVDGIEETSARNLRELELMTKDIGETTEITVVLTLRTGQVVRAEKTIVPSRVDIVLEADTLTPAFYQGRALPSTGSQVRAIAIPHTASGQAPEAFSYQWKLDNEVLYGGPVTGVHTANFEVGLGKNQVLRVDVLNNSGVIVAAKSIFIPRTEPELLFYEENPLRGINNIAIQSPHILVGEETSIRAEPYYMARTIFDSSPLIEWEIDGRA